jgi:clan AA aspartic protease (TIGR02281 family)
MLRLILTIVLLIGVNDIAAAEDDALNPVLDRLGIALPSEVADQRTIAQKLDELRREPCDQTAIFQLQKALDDAGYRREAANALIHFSGQCGDNAAALRRAANILLKLTDYKSVVEVTGKIIQIMPNNDNGYYLRGLAYDGLKDYHRAIADYVTSIELFFDKGRIANVGYMHMSDDYAALGQYCEAMRPIREWIALNPIRNDTSQTRFILAGLAHNGHCAAEASINGGETIAVPSGGKTIAVTVQVNGARGRFLLDTGATFVSVKRSFATSAHLFVREDSQIQLHTANGIAKAVLGRADKVELGKLEARNVTVAVQSDTDGTYGQGVDGLLGMSFLSRFDVKLDEHAVTIRARAVDR